jgi:hypothetical protein
MSTSPPTWTTARTTTTVSSTLPTDVRDLSQFSGPKLVLTTTPTGDWITVSNSYLHDHWKTSLVGHSDNNGDEDSGHLTVTYVYNYWQNLNSRTPSYRFGTGHIYNNYYESVNDGINTRDGAQLLVQNNVFSDVDKPLYSTDEGYAVASGNDFGDGENTALTGTISSVPYTYSLTATSSTKAYVVANVWPPALGLFRCNADIEIGWRHLKLLIKIFETWKGSQM